MSQAQARSGVLDVVFGVGGCCFDVLGGGLAFVFDVLGGVGGGGLDVFHGFLGGFLPALGHVFGGFGELGGDRFGRGLQGVGGFAFLFARGDEGGDEEPGAERDQPGGEWVALGFGGDLVGCVGDFLAGVVQGVAGGVGGLVHSAGGGVGGVVQAAGGAVGGVVGGAHDFLLDSEDCVPDFAGLAVDDVGGGDFVGDGVHVGAEAGAGGFDVGADGVRVLTHRWSPFGLRVGGISRAVSTVWGRPLMALSSLRPTEVRTAEMMAQMMAM